MKRTAPLRRRTRIAPMNAERRDRRFHEQYHSDDFVAWIHAQPCCVPGCESREIEASHVVSRGAGGTWRDVVPMCRAHHHEVHQLGQRTFSAKYALDLPVIARCHAGVWESRTADLAGPSSDGEGF